VVQRKKVNVAPCEPVGELAQQLMWVLLSVNQ